MTEQMGQDLLPGFVHDRYRVEAILGEDRLGVVIHAIDTRLKRAVAIRCLRANSGVTDQEDYGTYKDRFTQEIEVSARIGFHTNIVPILDFIIGDDDTSYLIVEYLSGGSLKSRLQRGPLPIAEALRITIDIANALAVAHAAGVVHRDINPGTLFLTAAGHAKVGGFGLAQIEAQESRTRAIMVRLGTPFYMSPEQEAYLHPATDQYSLGLVVFEMITGAKYKQIGESEAAQHLEQQPPALAALIARMVAKYPDDRFGSLGELAEACNTVLQQVELDEIRPDWAQESSAPPNDLQPISQSDGNNTLASAWAEIHTPAPSDDLLLGEHDPPSPLQSTAVHDARRSKLVIEIGLLLLLFCAIVGTYVAHYWMQLF